MSARVYIFQIRSNKVTFVTEAGDFGGLTWRHKGNLFKNYYPQLAGHAIWTVASLNNGKLKESMVYESYSFQNKYYRGRTYSSMTPITYAQYWNDSEAYFPTATCHYVSLTMDNGHRCTSSEIKKILTNPASVCA